jgi:hypothetical protein
MEMESMEKIGQKCLLLQIKHNRKFEQNVSNIFWRFASIGRHWWPFEANQKLGC